MTRPKLAPLFTWRSAICDSDLPPTTRHVALTLSLHMSERGDSAFPGAPLLAKETGLTERSCRDHLHALVTAGYLELIEQGGIKGARRRSNHYRAITPDGSLTTPEPPSGVGSGGPEAGPQPSDGAAESPIPEPDRTTPEPPSGVTPEPDAGDPGTSTRSTPEGDSPQFFSEDDMNTSSSSRRGDEEDEKGFDLEDAVDGWLDEFADLHRPTRRAAWKRTVRSNLAEDHPDVRDRILRLHRRHPLARAHLIGRQVANEGLRLDLGPTLTDLCDCDDGYRYPPQGGVARCTDCTDVEAVPA